MVRTRDCNDVLDVFAVINLVSAAVHINVPESPKNVEKKIGLSKTRRLRPAFASHPRYVERQHDLQTLDADFERAVTGAGQSGAVVVQNAVRSAADGNGHGMIEVRNSLEKKHSGHIQTDAVYSCSFDKMGVEGLETPAVNSNLNNNLRETPFPSGANSGAVEVQPPSALLSAVLELLKQLPDSDRARLADALRDGAAPPKGDAE